MSISNYFDEDELVSVLTTHPLNKLLDYFAPKGGCQLGAFVEVPLGKRSVLGVIWEKGKGDLDSLKIKKVIRVLDINPMRGELRKFLVSAAKYTLTPPSAMLRSATRVSNLLEPLPTQKFYRLSDCNPKPLTEARSRVLKVMQQQGGNLRILKDIEKQAKVSASVIKGLVKLGALAEEEHRVDQPFSDLDLSKPGKLLTEDQQTAVQDLCEKIRNGDCGTTLLQGVTGSGKTEVYLEAIAEVVKMKRQVLVLLPEIALAGEFLNRVNARFGVFPAEWHSGMTLTERRRIWHMVSEEKAQLVVGARSALFLPFKNLGLIIVDEEHDSSYKQEEGIFYNARDMSVLRATIACGHVILCSATPSLETWVNAKSTKYRKLILTKRFGDAELPSISAIDMRKEECKPQKWISPSLRTRITDRLNASEQTLLFVNRRGYAPVTLCRACGQQVGCLHCDARLVEHRLLNRLQCHQCGFSIPIPTSCSVCGAEGKLVSIGPGVERLAEEAKEYFPEASIVVLSSDMYNSIHELKAKISAISRGDADIIVGTQLVAKGHNFSKLTLVGVIDSDLSLQGSDLRAAERTFQLMRQVVGRAGRADKLGEAVLQTYQPDHPVIRAILSGDDEAFWAAEIAERKAAGMPPFGRLASIILSGSDQNVVNGIANSLAQNSKPLDHIDAQVFGPAPAPIARIRGRYRVRLLVKAKKKVTFQSALSRWIAMVKLKGDVRLNVDIDPQSFM
ncbi:MAG: primosomal protein N' [Aestuariivita sp.]|nr:primosomal protein N' [Aestuariivita sp.]